ncbi:hypothetical protein D7X98_09250 [bacterium 1XD8-76]|nr:hypothetical protein D7X98_09250 [bacterium 1XD8-76]
MTIRITGMNSGLDTESIITELASARSMKVDKIKKDQTKLSWKIDAWKELNSKIYSFYTDVLSDLRFDSAYTKKITKVSNPDAVSVVTGGNAVNGTQSLKVNKIATTAYLTGGKLTSKNGNNKVTGDTQLSDIGIEKETKFELEIGGKKQEISINGNETVADLTEKFSEAGLNAKFDEATGRFFISAKESGADAHFDIRAVSGDADSAAALKNLGLDYSSYYNSDGYSKGTDGATMIQGVDSEIELNGAVFTSSTNTFEINGLTITALKETEGETITLTTQQDTDGIYDTIKGFIKKYNELINEMDKLYNAESASKYEPLTSEEKDALSDTEVEEWEKKIKDALLRRDSTLSGVANAMKEAMMTTHLPGVEGINEGKDIYLSYFGIETLGYFKAKDNEKNAYHINGDPDDSTVKNNEEKLKKAIANNPDTVVEFFKQLSTNLYNALDEKMGRTDYSSSFTVYNDKLMNSELEKYESKIKTEQDKLNDYIDRWYQKFSQMEVALSKLNSKESSISSLFG